VYSRQVPFPLVVLQFPIDRNELVEYGFRVASQVFVTQAVGQIRDRPASVRRSDIKEIAELRRKTEYAQVPVQTARSAIGCAQKVLQIAGALAEFLDFMFILLVVRLQLFINALQLFL